MALPSKGLDAGGFPRQPTTLDRCPAPSRSDLASPSWGPSSRLICDSALPFLRMERGMHTTSRVHPRCPKNSCKVRLNGPRDEGTFPQCAREGLEIGLQVSLLPPVENPRHQTRWRRRSSGVPVSWTCETVHASGKAGQCWSSSGSAPGSTPVLPPTASLSGPGRRPKLLSHWTMSGLGDCDWSGWGEACGGCALGAALNGGWEGQLIYLAKRDPFFIASIPQT